MEITWWQAMVLGVVQGATEFLPVSSSGHLVLFQHLLDLQLPGVTFEVVVHLGTLTAVLFAYRQSIRYIVISLLARLPDLADGRAGRQRFWHDAGARWAVLLLIGSIPAGLAGFILKSLLEGLFGSLQTAAIGWLVTAAVLTAATVMLGKPQPAGRLRDHRHPPDPLEGREVKPGSALLIGAFQALALVPGISRSGSTVAAGLLSGLTPATAARFSFLLAVPAIGGAAVLDMFDIIAAAAWSTLPPVPLVLGFGAAAASGYASIRVLVAALMAGRLRPFIIYCAALAFLAWMLEGF